MSNAPDQVTNHAAMRSYTFDTTLNIEDAKRAVSKTVPEAVVEPSTPGRVVLYAPESVQVDTTEVAMALSPVEAKEPSASESAPITDQATAPTEPSAPAPVAPAPVAPAPVAPAPVVAPVQG